MLLEVEKEQVIQIHHASWCMREASLRERVLHVGVVPSGFVVVGLRREVEVDGVQCVEGGGVVGAVHQPVHLQAALIRIGSQWLAAQYLVDVGEPALRRHTRGKCATLDVVAANVDGVGLVAAGHHKGEGEGPGKRDVGGGDGSDAGYEGHRRVQHRL